MSGFSNFLSQFNGVTRLDGSNIDIISNYNSVDSSNNSYGHTGKDYYMYLGNILIQFSGTPVSNLSETSARLTNGTSYTFKLPISTSSNPPWIVLVSDVSSSNTIIDVVSISNSMNEFSVRIGNANGNFSWIAIGPAS